MTLFPPRDVFVILCIIEETITEQIYLIHKAYKTKSSFHHSKENQDSSINCGKLYLLTQLKVQSGKLAGKFHIFEDLEYHHSVNMMISFPATLSIQGMDVTSKYWHQIWAYVEPIYEGHMQTKF